MLPLGWKLSEFQLQSATTHTCPIFVKKRSKGNIYLASPETGIYFSKTQTRDPSPDVAERDECAPVAAAAGVGGRFLRRDP